MLGVCISMLTRSQARYAFISNYDGAQLFRKDDDALTGGWSLQYSPVIHHATKGLEGGNCQTVYLYGTVSFQHSARIVMVSKSQQLRKLLKAYCHTQYGPLSVETDATSSIHISLHDHVLMSECRESVRRTNQSERYALPDISPEAKVFALASDKRYFPYTEQLTDSGFWILVHAFISVTE